jgi:hypothetical protein
MNQKKEEFEEIRRHERIYNMMVSSKAPIDVKTKNKI